MGHDEGFEGAERMGGRRDMKDWGVRGKDTERKKGRGKRENVRRKRM